MFSKHSKKFYSNNFEISGKIYFIFKQLKFSKKLRYLAFNNQKSSIFVSTLNSKCLVSQLSRPRKYNSKIGFSRFSLSDQVAKSYLPGFYFAVW
jgi:hypothetical protein